MPLARALPWAFALALGPLVYWGDRALTDGGTIGRERNAVRGAHKRVAAGSDADGIVLLGSSTTRDWLRMRWLARVFGEETDAVVDAHINGCHQGCTWAQVRALAQQGRHFRVAIFGTNQFQLCEHEHAKRVLQHRSLMPASDTAALLRAYLHAEHPARYVGRYAFGAASTTYADSTAVQERLASAVLGAESPRRDTRWVRRKRFAKDRLAHCSYDSEAVAFKAEVSRQLAADLAQLADRVFVLLLPDRALDGRDPSDIEAWAAHRALHEQLAAAHANVWLIDLTANGPWTEDRFRDDIHLDKTMHLRQRQAFAAQLQAGGHITP